MSYELDGLSISVAPFVGAWIEIVTLFGAIKSIKESLPSRERGLKLTCLSREYPTYPSLPSRERGLK